MPVPLFGYRAYVRAKPEGLVLGGNVRKLMRWTLASGAIVFSVIASISSLALIVGLL